MRKHLLVALLLAVAATWLAPQTDACGPGTGSGPNPPEICATPVGR